MAAHDQETLAITKFRQYLRIDTEQPNPDYYKCRDFLFSYARELGFEPWEYECVPGKPIVGMTFVGSDQTLPSLLLYSHTDVKVEEMIAAWCKEAGTDVTYEFIQKGTGKGVTSTDPSDPWKCAISKEIFIGGTDARHLRQVGIPAIGFSPMINTPILLHDHNEFLNERVFLRGVQLYAKMVPRLANLPAF
uniref:M20_dimer domain-containing protein n=1 Tax=Globodera pallida TaxID=36090 RepID=A0A183CHP8_GLOPA